MNYSISAGHEITASVAEDVLLGGGNAFDAALAAYCTSFVTEPCMSSAGGGSFALLKPFNGPPQLVDFFCQTPRSKFLHTDMQFDKVTVDFGEMLEDFYVGLASIAVPGALKGIFEIHKRYGRVPFHELIELAVEVAKDGVVLNAFQHLDLILLEDIFSRSEVGRSYFYKGDKLKEIGDIVKMDELADFLDYFSREGPDAFYKGEVAQKIVESSRNNGGFLGIEDFEHFEVIFKEPLKASFGHQHIFTNAFPSMGGGILGIFVKKYQNYLIHEGKSHLDKELMINAYLDCQVMNNQLEKIIKSFDHLFHQYHIPPDQGGQVSRGTTHFNIIDKDHNVIAITSSIGEGSGFYIPDTGIHMNNMLGEAALLPGGFHSWAENERLGSMMTPTLLIDEEEHSSFAFGSGGAGRIPYMIGQVLLHILHGEKSLESAVNAPRLHIHENRVEMEPGWDGQYLSEHYKDLTFNPWQNKSLYFGGVHVSSTSPFKWDAEGDQRRDGVSVKH